MLLELHIVLLELHIISVKAGLNELFALLIYRPGVSRHHAARNSDNQRPTAGHPS